MPPTNNIGILIVESTRIYIIQYDNELGLGIEKQEFEAPAINSFYYYLDMNKSPWFRYVGKRGGEIL